jgi:hypothetical protein
LQIDAMQRTLNDSRPAAQKALAYEFSDHRRGKPVQSIAPR